ncbi:MAG TPA: serine hydrolase domain-containing protein [Longimicrobiales bacterium]|nr:serine hydrolase domain-containing protein [Longimicrobiales bacterium]
MRRYVAFGSWLFLAAAVPVQGRGTEPAMRLERSAAFSSRDLAARTDWAELTRRFDRYFARDAVVGGSMVLIRDGRISAEHHRGLADASARRPVDRNTIYHYGSITKTLTAIAIMQLRDRGRLALDEPITRRLPELRRVHDPFGKIDSITIRMLLSHSAGFQNPTWPYRDEAWQPFEPTTWEQLVAMMPYQRLLFEPGSRYGYSNPAFIYLARVIEQVSGDPWQAYVQKNLFMPLQLDRSYFGTTPPHLARDRAHGYEVRSGAAGRDTTVDNGPDFDPGITIPNGGWNAPLEDLARYLAFLTASERDGIDYSLVLSRPSLEEMWRPVVPVAEGVAMGLSFFRYESAGERALIGHTGTQGGFRSFLYFDPPSRRGVVLVFNTTHDRSPGAEDLSSLLASVEAYLRRP